MNEFVRQIALACGAANAACIQGGEIVLSASFRDACESNACGNYGKCYMCPPDVGDIHRLMETVLGYRSAMLYQTIYPLEDSYDYEGMAAAGMAHGKVAQTIERALRKTEIAPSLHLAAGGCKVCEICAKRAELPCRHPDLAMASLESYGVDVYNTALHAGLPYINGQNTVTYFGMVL